MKKDELLCDACDGSGMGRHEGTNCTQCQGMGLAEHEPEGWI